MKTTIRIVLVLLLALMSGFAVLQAQEELIFTVPVLYDGDVIETEFNNDMTTQLYAFVATEGDTVTISMTQEDGSELDPFLVLLGSAGEVLAVDDDGGDVSLSSKIEYIVPVTDTYFVVASSYVFIDGILMEEGADYGVLPFTISLTGNTLPPDAKTDETPLVIYHGTLENGVTIEGVSSPEEPVYFYLFGGSAGDTANITIDSVEFPPILHVFSPSGVRIAMGVNLEEGSPAEVSVELPEDGVYIVFATDIFFYEAVNYTTESTDELQFTGGTFNITLDLTTGDKK